MENIAFNNSAFGAQPLISLAARTSSVWDMHQMRTSHLYLRPVGPDDFNDYLALYSDPAVMRFIGIEAGYVPRYEEISQLFESAVEAWIKRGYGRWSLFDVETLEFVGFCGFRCENETPELIAALHQRFWGRDLAAEAAAACIKYGYEKLNFTKVKAFTRPSHTRARQVLRKLEARFDGYIDFHGVCGACYELDAQSYQNKIVVPN